MNVASSELCKELYELSGWGGESTEFHYYREPDDEALQVQHVTYCPFYAEDQHYPAYDLGYLLRKLPANVVSREYQGKYAQLWLRKQDEESVLYFGFYAVMSEIDCRSDFGVHAETPEDVAAKLSIELFKQGILTKTESGDVS